MTLLHRDQAAYVASRQFHYITFSTSNTVRLATTNSVFVGVVIGRHWGQATEVLWFRESSTIIRVKYCADVMTRVKFAMRKSWVC